jgi:hypothetical protein
MHSFGGTRPGSKPGSATHDLLPLLKVRTVHALLVTLLIVANYWFELASSLSDRPRLLIETFFGLFERNVGYWIIGFAIIGVVQTRIAAGRTRTMVLLSSMLVWAALWSLFWTVWAPLSPFIVVELGLTTPSGFAMDGVWTTTTYLLLAAWYYESADRARRSTAALREGELVRRGAERWLLELRLGARQARLDPQVLFDTLDEAGRLYRSRPAAAELLLDSLIDYLRLVLPQLWQAESTLEREVALALAYARVLRTREGEPLELESHVEPGVGNARFPPMVVQPLCETVARPTLVAREPARLHISASRKSDAVHICVTAQAVQSPLESERLAEIRHTLSAMFAPLVRVDAMHWPSAGVVSVVVQVPYVAAPRIDS